MDAFSVRQSVRKAAVASRGGVVAAQSGIAARVGARALAEGGNAVDAAVATALASGVAEPWMSGLGGGGAMVVRMGGVVTAIDCGMRAPAALDPADYPVVEGAADDDLFGWPPVAGARNLRGVHAVAVPGALDGVRLAHQRYGRLPWADLVEPAVALAEAGVELDWFAYLMISAAARELAPDPTSKGVWLEADGYPHGSPPDGSRRLVSPNLAATLARIAVAGPRDFYEGEIARAIADDVGAAGGSLSRDDLANYEAREFEPAICDHHGARLHFLPHLNGGPTVAAALQAAEAAYRPEAGPGPDFYGALASGLLRAFETRLAEMGAGPEGSCTTHLSVVDGDGNMVAFTNTLLSVFGAKFTLPSTGMLMNNGINWFDPRPGRPNSLGAGKKPLSNYAPMIGEAGERRFAIGASGGRKIISGIAQMAAYLGVFGDDLETAAHRPRFDVSGGARITADPRLGEAALERLEALAEVDRRPARVALNQYSIVSAVMREGGVNHGASDPLHPWADAHLASETAVS